MKTIKIEFKVKDKAAEEIKKGLGSYCRLVVYPGNKEVHFVPQPPGCSMWFPSHNFTLSISDDNQKSSGQRNEVLEFWIESLEHHLEETKRDLAEIERMTYLARAKLEKRGTG